MYRFKTGYVVADAMTHKPVAVSPSKTLRDAAKLMRDEHVGSLLVKEGDTIVGMLTEGDIVKKAVASSGNPSLRKVKEVMATDLVTTSPDEDIFEAIRIMRDYNVRHLPVMHSGKFVGLVTLKDLLKLEPDLYEILAENIQVREEIRRKGR